MKTLYECVKCGTQYGSSRAGHMCCNQFGHVYIKEIPENQKDTDFLREYQKARACLRERQMYDTGY